MARKSGLTPLWKKSDIRKLFDKLGERAEFIIMDILQRTGEEFVKIARLEGNYIDHTGNLRSSIGYVIVKDGSIVGRNFQVSEQAGTDKQTGKREGEQLAMDLVRTFSKGYVMIGVAGMKYAIFVEAMENKDVLTRAADKADDFIKKHSRLLFNRLAA
ncbi:MAG: HK97 gp10 family phage protein [Bacteroides xylanisolvens]